MPVRVRTDQRRRSRADLLRDRDGLEVHAEDRRGADVGLARVVETVDLIQDGLDLVAVVLLGGGVDVRPVVVLRVRDTVRHDSLRVDLRREEVVDALAVRARTIERRVDLVLVRPSGAQAGLVDDLVDRVVAEVVPRGDRLAGLRVYWERARVERRLRVELQVHDRGRVGVEAVGEDRTVLVERREGCRSRVRRGRGRRASASSGES